MEDDDDLRFSVIEEDSDGDSDAIDGVIDYEDDDDVFGGDDEISARKAGLRKKGSSSSLGAAVVTGRRHLEDIKQIMGLDSFKAKKEKRKERKRRAKLRKAEQREREKSSGVVLTAATRAKSTPVLPEVIEYKDPKKRKRKQETEEQELAPREIPEKKMKKSSSLPETTMKSARFDVFKFGMRGMDRASREDAEVARLVSLGARKPKNKGYGYKELKEMRSKEREEEKRKKEEERISGVRIAALRKSTSASAASGKSKSSPSSTKKSKPGSGGIQSKIGSFDGGMLKLSAKDLAKIKGQKKQK